VRRSPAWRSRLALWCRLGDSLTQPLPPADCHRLGRARRCGLRGAVSQRAADRRRRFGERRRLQRFSIPAREIGATSDQVVRLVAGLPVRLASTLLIEAGVHISLPELWRAWAGLSA
jgi:hypothetical protein